MGFRASCALLERTKRTEAGLDTFYCKNLLDQFERTLAIFEDHSGILRLVMVPQSVPSCVVDAGLICIHVGAM